MSESSIVEMFVENFKPENICLFIYRFALTDTKRLSELIYGDKEVIDCITKGTEKDYYVVKKFCDFFGVKEDMFLINPSIFDAQLRNLKLSKSRVDQLIADAKRKEKLNAKIGQLSLF